MNEIEVKYKNLGGETGFLGPPISVETVARDNVGRYRDYQNGSIYWHPDTGAYEVHGAIRAKWRALDAELSNIGYPTSDETDVTSGSYGRYNTFQRGDIYWNPSAGANEIKGAIRTRWEQLGGTGSPLGYPTTDELATPKPNASGRFNHFEDGSIYWHPKTGANEVFGPIRSTWQNLGWEKSYLGFPASGRLDTYDSQGHYNVFQGGNIYWHPTNGIIIVDADVRKYYVRYDADNGFLGLPISEKQNIITSSYKLAGWQQEFEGGRIRYYHHDRQTRVIATPSATFPNYLVNLRAIIVADDDGSRRANVTRREIKQWIYWANDVFAVAGIRINPSFTMESMDDTKVNDVMGEKSEHWDYVKDKLNGISQDSGMIVIFRHGPDKNPTGGGFSSSNYNFIAMPRFEYSNLCGRPHVDQLGHEIGHYLGLPHTHSTAFNTLADAENHFIIKNQDPSIFDGDRNIISDTPPDPYIIEYQCNTDINTVLLGETSFAVARNNVMSYWYCDFPEELTYGQVLRARQKLQQRIKQHGLSVETFSSYRTRSISRSTVKGKAAKKETMEVIENKN